MELPEFVTKKYKEDKKDKELFMNDVKNLKDLNKDYAKGLKAAYDNSEWQLTRFDTGAYWLDLK